MASLKEKQFAFERSCDAINLMIEHFSEPREWLPTVWFRAFRHLNRDADVPVEAHEDFDFLLDVMDDWIHIPVMEGLRIRPEITAMQLVRAAVAVQAVAHAITAAYAIALDEAKREVEAAQANVVVSAAWLMFSPFGAYSPEDPALVRLREWVPPIAQPKN